MNKFDKFLQKQIIYNNGLFEQELESSVKNQRENAIVSKNEQTNVQPENAILSQNEQPNVHREITSNDPKHKQHIPTLKEETLLTKKEGFTLVFYAILLLTLSWSYFFYRSNITDKNIDATAQKTSSAVPDNKENFADLSVPDNSTDQNPPPASGTNLPENTTQNTQQQIPDTCKEILNGAIVNQKINLNTSTITELQVITGVGPSTAQKIIDYRTQNGKFTSIEELMEVAGIGEKTFAKLKDNICV
ncbi:MAG: helix-hairpin-helix domain-containing protein [Bifidobacteriaceae bacterium]|jgi:competence protein ComEA|nr:helix-hairpin-helix domain-containing protein [Bifidobacteriaceae bacterium]